MDYSQCLPECKAAQDDADKKRAEFLAQYPNSCTACHAVGGQYAHSMSRDDPPCSDWIDCPECTARGMCPLCGSPHGWTDEREPTTHECGWVHNKGPFGLPDPECFCWPEREQMAWNMPLNAVDRFEESSIDAMMAIAAQDD